MSTIEKIKANIEADKGLRGVNAETFIEAAATWIKAIKEQRMICTIGSVSQSGMSRTMKFTSCEKGKHKDMPFWYRNYFMLMRDLGFTPVKNGNYFRIGGCGMDMVFHTNYTIIHRLHRLGFINKKDCDKLAQMTPHVI